MVRKLDWKLVNQQDQFREIQKLYDGYKSQVDQLRASIEQGSNNDYKGRYEKIEKANEYLRNQIKEIQLENQMLSKSLRIAEKTVDQLSEQNKHQLLS